MQCTPVELGNYEFTGTLVPEDCSGPVEFTGQLHWIDDSSFEVWDCPCDSLCTDGDPQLFEISGTTLQHGDSSGGCVNVSATRSDCQDQFVHVVQTDSQVDCEIVAHYSKVRAVRENGDAVELQLPGLGWEAIDNSSTCTTDDESTTYVHDVQVNVKGSMSTILEGELFDFDCPALPGEDESYAHRVSVLWSRQDVLTPWAFEPTVEITAQAVMN